MATVQALTSIGIIVSSFMIGLLFFYFLSPLNKKEKKFQLEETVSLIINFIIFLWVGKIIINFSQFIRDPLAILAYPSNSSAFYIACFLIILNVIYKVKRHKFQFRPLLTSFIPIFLVANFVYEFIQIVIYGNTWTYMALLLVLIMLYLLLFEKRPHILSYVLILSWSIGQLVFSFIFPYTTVLDFMLSPWFFGVVIIITLVFLNIDIRKKVS